ARALVVYGALARAVRRESALAVAHHWGVTPQTVRAWRRALGVGPSTEGTSRLRGAYAREHPAIVGGRQKALGKAQDPERRRKIADANRGKSKPAHVVEAVRRAHLGT